MKRDTQAERQARSRAKKAAEKQELLGLLYRLERSVWAAHDAGDPLGQSVARPAYPGILEALCEEFESRATGTIGGAAGDAPSPKPRGAAAAESSPDPKQDSSSDRGCFSPKTYYRRGGA